MSKIKILFLVSFFFLSCAKTKVIKGPDGSDHKLVSCPSVEYCYEEASRACDGRYKIINSSSENHGTEHNTISTIKLLIKCEK